MAFWLIYLGGVTVGWFAHSWWASRCDCTDGVHHAHENCDDTCSMRLCGGWR